MLATVEKFADCIGELKESIIQSHYEELALNKDKVPLIPNWDKYILLENADALVHISLREDGILIGYFIGVVDTHLHYMQTKMFTMDIMYVSPKHRNSNGGMLLMEKLEEECRRRGVQKMILNTKKHFNIGALYVRRGFKHIEEIYSKWIGE